MLRGEQRRLVTPGKNEKLYLAGALDVRTGVLHSRNHPCKTMKALLGKARTYLEGYVWRRVTGAAPILRRAA